MYDIGFENIDKLEGAFTASYVLKGLPLFENIDKLEGAFTLRIPLGSH